MAKKDYYSFVTPLGRARFPKLDKQDMYEGKEVGYKLGIVFEGEALKKVQAEVEKAIAALTGGSGLKKGKKTPLREDEKNDTTYFEAKSYKLVPLVGAKASQKLPAGTKVGGGSLVRAEVSLSIGNGHLVAYMNGVQVAELKQGGGSGFDDLDGFDDQPDVESEGFSDVGADDLDI